MDPLTVTALVSLVALVYFVYVGINKYAEIENASQFFLCAKSMRRKEFSASFAASSTSLATALIFFVTLGATFGLPVLLAPVTYFLGAYVMSRFLNRESIQATVREGTSLMQFLNVATGSPTVSFIICLVPALGVLSILLIEFYVGVSIFSVFAAQGTANVQLTLALLSVLIMIYTAIGGFPAVVKTDAVQLNLIWLGALAVFLLCLFHYLTAETQASIDWAPNPLFGNGFILLPAAITFNVVVINAFLQFTQLRTWQMIAASRSSGEVRTGLLRGAFSVALLWTVFALVGILARPVLGIDTSSIDSFLRSMNASPNLLIAYIALPIFFVACMSALVSTADSALLPLSQFVNERMGTNQNNLLTPRIIIVVFVLLVNVMYHLVFNVLKYDFLQLLFTIFGLVIVTGPVIILAIFRPSVLKTRGSGVFAIASVYIGAAIIVGFSYWADPVNVPMGAPIGFLAAAAIMGLLWVYAANRTGRTDG